MTYRLLETIVFVIWIPSAVFLSWVIAKRLKDSFKGTCVIGSIFVLSMAGLLVWNPNYKDPVSEELLIVYFMTAGGLQLTFWGKMLVEYIRTKKAAVRANVRRPLRSRNEDI